ncbi:hypothetical protein [Oricola thermophila]|uniref:Uncharacterized protein n=1 Tax=Oricola thermophila TaxID=2742145 RepID=A0A6N1V8G6_9HYPH|nr:hypothetical protein [Oricola thermophila]QKV17256.1 hypothetical protein HTY61_01645 [Oricola thermophila]
MRTDVSPGEIVDLICWSGFEPAPRLSGCVGALLPPIRELEAVFGTATLVYALAAILAELALECDDNARAALLLRNCARIVEIETSRDRSTAESAGSRANEGMAQ